MPSSYPDAAAWRPRRRPSNRSPGGRVSITNASGGRAMLVLTTNAVEGRKIVRYHGIVSGEAILGANIFKDLFAGKQHAHGQRQRHGRHHRRLRPAVTSH
jgi:hypothetical protein